PMATFIDAAERRPALQRTHATVAKPLKATLPRWSIVVGGAAVASQTRERMKSAALARRMVQVRVNRCGHAPCWIPSVYGKFAGVLLLMESPPPTTDVLIVGAGPTGLTLALALTPRGQGPRPPAHSVTGR